MSNVNIISRFLKDRRASISVETGLIMTVLIVMAMGVFDFGTLYARKMELANAVRAGMQYGLVRKPIASDFTAIGDAVNTSLSSHDRAESSEVSVSMYCECSDGTSKDCLGSSGSSLTCDDGNLRSAYLLITLSESFSLLFAYPGINPSVTLRETATVRLN